MKAPIIMVPAAIGINALLKKKKNTAGTENPRGTRIVQYSLRFRCAGEMFEIRFANQPRATTAAMQPDMGKYPGGRRETRRSRELSQEPIGHGRALAALTKARSG